jgi:hypothetical protein
MQPVLLDTTHCEMPQKPGQVQAMAWRDLERQSAGHAKVELYNAPVCIPKPVLSSATGQHPTCLISNAAPVSWIEQYTDAGKTAKHEGAGSAVVSGSKVEPVSGLYMQRVTMVIWAHTLATTCKPSD